MTKSFRSIFAAALLLTAACIAVAEDNDRAPILPALAKSPMVTVSTVPANGDLNPYGVAFVPPEFPRDSILKPGDILVSNFNNAQNSTNTGNLQGTGRTIVAIRGTKQFLFFQGPSGLGLTTALGVLPSGIVLVGNVPTTDGTSATVQQGSLIAIDRHGKQIASFSDPIFLDGPWDLTLVQRGDDAIVFVSNVLNGTVARLQFEISRDGEHIELDSAARIAEGYVARTDPAALVVGPTGLALDRDFDALYVASTGDNAIYAVSHPFTRWEPEWKGRLVYTDNAHLRGPLGLLLAPNGNLITTNGDAVNPDANFPSEMVEFTQSGHFVAQLSVDTTGQGGAFGIALAGHDDSFRLAAVDDVANTLKVWKLPN
jgi:hypothetical protein